MINRELIDYLSQFDLNAQVYRTEADVVSAGGNFITLDSIPLEGGRYCTGYSIDTPHGRRIMHDGDTCPVHESGNEDEDE